MSVTYDSRPETEDHIRAVQGYVCQLSADLLRRGVVHDQSKLVEPELSIFDEYTPKLKASTYGSPEYEKFRQEMGEGLTHHYRANDHHPEHHANGIADMHLGQIVEMLCDWKAATMRHDDADIRKSVEMNADRFGYGEELKTLLLNTVEAYGW